MPEPVDIPPLRPGGAEYTLMAARVAGLTAGAQCLDIGTGHGIAAITLAKHIHCRVTAFDKSADRIKAARGYAEAHGVADLISFEVRDAQRANYAPASFDLVVAEGGVIATAFASPDAGVTRVVEFVRPGGALAISDLVYTLSPPPDTVRDRFPHLWTERKYTDTLDAHGAKTLFACWVARRGWRAFIAASGEQRDFWESRDARAALAYLYIVAAKSSQE